VSGPWILHSTENFVAVLGGEAFYNPGYVLICPKAHYLSVAMVPPGLYREFGSLVGLTAEIIASQYEGMIIGFEHGSMPSDEGKTSTFGGNSITHAHFHMASLPHGSDLVQKVNSVLGYSCREIGLLSDLHDSVEGRHGYQMILQRDSLYMVDISLQEGSPSQFLRHQCAEIVEQSGYQAPFNANWRNGCHTELWNEAYRQLRPHYDIARLPEPGGWAR